MILVIKHWIKIEKNKHLDFVHFNSPRITKKQLKESDKKER